MQSGQDILDRAVELRDWAAPMKSAADRSTAVWAGLRLDHSVEDVRRAVLECLTETGRVMWTGGKLDRAQLDRTDIGLKLMGRVEELDPGPDLTAEFVRHFDSILASNALSGHVTRHLSAAQLFDTLAVGARNAPGVMARASCLDAVRLYYPAVSRPSDPAELQRSLSSLEKEVRRAEETASSYPPDDAALMRECAANARKTLQGIRRRRTDVPRHTGSEFKAYRVEDGPKVVHVVEWLDGGVVAITVQRLEIKDRTLRLDYLCHDLALLPEDVPAVLEDALFHRYAQDEFATQVDEIVYLDLRTKESVKLPYPR